MGGRYRGGRSGGDLNQASIDRFQAMFREHGVTSAIAHEVYSDNNGERTLALYRHLESLGMHGQLAKHLFRAHKTSGRAKVYRGGGFKGMAYGRKGESLDAVSRTLTTPEMVGLYVWGWKTDPKQHRHSWVLYVELPTGQVSFHAERRGIGPDFPGDWDGQHGVGDLRICRFIGTLHGEAVERIYGKPADVAMHQEAMAL